MSRRPILQTQNPFIVTLGFLLCGGLCCINLTRLFSNALGGIDSNTSDDETTDTTVQPATQVYAADRQQSGVIQRRPGSSEPLALSVVNTHSIFQEAEERERSLPKSESLDHDWDICQTAANFNRTQQMK